MLFFFILLISLYSGSSSAEKRLKFVVVITRHGARAPTRPLAFDEVYWQGYGDGELTAGGMRQHYLIGAELRRRYVETQQFLSGRFSADEVYVLSSTFNRTIQSAQSLLYGLFPNYTGSSLNIPIRPPMNVTNAAKIEEKLGVNALPFGCQPVPIETIPYNKDIFFHANKQCPKVLDINTFSLTSDMYLQQQNFWIQTRFPEISKSIGMEVNSIDVAKKVASNLEWDIANGFPVPLNEDQYQFMMSVRDFHMFYTQAFTEDQLNLEWSSIFTELGQRLNASQMNTSTLKFVLYSAHDTTLVSILSCLESSITQAPPFASNLVIELWDDLYIRVLYNDRPLNMADWKNGKCSLKTFQEILEKRKVPYLEEECGKEKKRKEKKRKEQKRKEKKRKEKKRKKGKEIIL